jgi:hypothetical protein
MAVIAAVLAVVVAAQLVAPAAMRSGGGHRQDERGSDHEHPCAASGSGSRSPLLVPSTVVERRGIAQSKGWLNSASNAPDPNAPVLSSSVSPSTTRPAYAGRFATRIATQLRGTVRYGLGFSLSAVPGNPQKPGRQGISWYTPGGALPVFETAPFDRSGIPPRALYGGSQSARQGGLAQTWHTRKLRAEGACHMATTQKRGDRWRVQVTRKGQKPVSRSFGKHAEAKRWATAQEATERRLALAGRSPGPQAADLRSATAGAPAGGLRLSADCVSVLRTCNRLVAMAQEELTAASLG